LSIAKRYASNNQDFMPSLGAISSTWGKIQEEVLMSNFLVTLRAALINWQESEADIENYLDLLEQLSFLPGRNPESGEAIAALTDIVGGEIRAEGDTYFLVDKNGRRVAVNMIAEGI
nr:hypothetical protein [Tanacetum cinerariifolium]